MSTTIKDRILESLEQLPASATVEDAMERLYFLSKVERGIQDLEAGHTVSHADVKAKYAR